MIASRKSLPRGKALALLAGLTPAQFMRRYWQKKPLLVRGAMPRLQPLLSRARLFALAARDGVESRLVVRERSGAWTLADGPLKRSELPPTGQSRWTLLVQGVDLHDDGAHEWLQRFRFVPDARLDDLMISWASDGGGVGPHVDSYDVFLLQAAGRRRWRIGRPHDLGLEKDAPLKILRRFVASEEHVLEPGDLLYLPPGWAHEGIAEGGECMTYSIGMRAPQRGALAGEVVQRLADELRDETLYRDPRQAEATQRPALIPRELRAFGRDAVRRLVSRPAVLARALGEVLSEPKPRVWFERPTTEWRAGAVVLDRRTRMLYDERQVFINGEATRFAGKDASLLRRLANERRLDARAVRGASATVRALLGEWFGAGWLHARDG